MLFICYEHEGSTTWTRDMPKLAWSPLSGSIACQRKISRTAQTSLRDNDMDRRDVDMKTRKNLFIASSPSYGDTLRGQLGTCTIVR